MATLDTPTMDVIVTEVLPVRAHDLGHFVPKDGKSSVDTWDTPHLIAPGMDVLQRAAILLRTGDLPVGFPTETVYGLGADATRSNAVKGIYKAKGRPSDNPLIIHISDLDMLRNILTSNEKNGDGDIKSDPIPSIYKPLIDKFWPGPLTILLPNPEDSKLAPEVTSGLKTFGVRMPNSPLALTLIKLAGVPIAAPSANASTKPSPTTAQHVLHDLHGKIELIIDGGSCEVGVESTVVDGLCSPPVILRPGGLSIDSIRECPGWEHVTTAYKDQSEIGGTAPRAPGMKYKHYSPKAKVILYENGAPIGSQEAGGSAVHSAEVVGIVRTKRWKPWSGWNVVPVSSTTRSISLENGDFLESVSGTELQLNEGELRFNGSTVRVIEIDLGDSSKVIAHGLFSALRELDRRNADVIYVEGIEDKGDIAAAVMNRLRKAATEIKY